MRWFGRGSEGVRGFRKGSEGVRWFGKASEGVRWFGRATEGVRWFGRASEGVLWFGRGDEDVVQIAPFEMCGGARMTALLLPPVCSLVVQVLGSDHWLLLPSPG